MVGRALSENMGRKEVVKAMRIAFVGAGELTVRSAELLIKRGHEVIIIENEEEKIDALSEILDCSFLHGDGSKPAILREVGPEQTDVLFCLTNNDQANLISSLVGRSLGFKRVIPSIEDPSILGRHGRRGRYPGTLHRH